jgi:hypothetical protein
MILSISGSIILLIKRSSCNLRVHLGNRSHWAAYILKPITTFGSLMPLEIRSLNSLLQAVLSLKPGNHLCLKRVATKSKSMTLPTMAKIVNHLQVNSGFISTQRTPFASDLQVQAHARVTPPSTKILTSSILLPWHLRPELVLLFLTTSMSTKRTDGNSSTFTKRKSNTCTSEWSIRVVNRHSSSNWHITPLLAKPGSKQLKRLIQLTVKAIGN